MDFCILNFSTSCPLVSHALPCLLVPLCYVLTWKPLALSLIFLWSSITVPQSWKQIMLVLTKGVLGHINDDVQPIIVDMV